VAGTEQTLTSTYLARAPFPVRAASRTRDIYRFRHLVRYLVSTSLRTENVGTVFGFLWWLLDPLLLMAVYTVLIDVVLRRGGPNYPLFVLAAILSWEFFVRSTRNSMGFTLQKERAMRQVAFPKSVVPLSATLAEGVHFLMALVLFLVFALPFGIYPSPLALLAIPIAAIQFLFTLGVAFFLAALNMFFRDANHLSDYVFRLWFYLSPGLYAATLIPDRYRTLYDLNPFATLFNSFRDVLLDHRLPDFAALGGVAGVSVVVLLLGYLYFISVEPSFAKVD
jgi:ABC-type polysaccharide/polyol phosphate export permease